MNQNTQSGQTPSQTVGPYFAYGLTPRQYGYDHGTPFGPVLATDDTPGERIRLEGQVLDAQGAPIDDAMIEIVQADARGRFASDAATRTELRFAGFGRCGTGTDAQHRFVFETVKPGATAPDAAPAIDVIVFMRGMLSHAFTRVYFEDEGEANARDAVLAAVPEARRATLVARRVPGATGLPTWRFDIRMQGAQETVFFDR